MILSKEVEVTISNQGQYYKALGYTNTKQGSKILVKIEHLPTQSNIKVNCECDKCSVQFSRQYQLIMKNKKYVEHLYCFDCTRKFLGSKIDTTNASKRMKKISGEKHPRWNINKKAFNAYAYKVRRLSEETYIKYKNEINPTDFPRTLCGIEGGYQLDHKISIQRGFKMGLNPIIVASKQNLQMLPWKTNRSKHYK